MLFMGGQLSLRGEFGAELEGGFGVFERRRLGRELRRSDFCWGGVLAPAAVANGQEVAGIGGGFSALEVVEVNSFVPGQGEGAAFVVALGGGATGVEGDREGKDAPGDVEVAVE